MLHTSGSVAFMHVKDRMGGYANEFGYKLASHAFECQYCQYIRHNNNAAHPLPCMEITTRKVYSLRPFSSGEWNTGTQLF